ncbi:DUF4383 domain-containing protein [Saccharomonospora sp. NPDC046836]|uniref:DUF4383 domain-containing protein n=1 Tax=Saccharomonospora sp. NPDC046836 TaxID=3156921 RepID=UPI0033F2D685
MDRPTETQLRPVGLQPAQVLAGVVGLIFLVLGVAGLIRTGFANFLAAQHGELWVFTVNPLHNVVHVVVGVLGLCLALTSASARVYGWVLFAGFGALFVWGLAVTGVFVSNPVSGLGNTLALNAADNWLHLGGALLGLVIATMPARKRVVSAAEPAQPQPSTGQGDRQRPLWGGGDAHTPDHP